ncbi:MAG TPA: CDP-alcohol phosphatidyltransferase family protein [Acidimicrobiales bacterium]|nr:CDP-alcohol phosphatidyltransferase family protein [Acidimicrobiales bacterium]
MFDRRLRAAVDRPLTALAGRAAARGVRADWVTLAGFLLGVGACVAIAVDQRIVALVLWLANRVADGLDGAIARRIGVTDRGGFVDIVADFAIYGGFVVGVAYAQPDARLAVVVLLFAYYVSGTAFLAWSSLAERRARIAGDNRSLHFVGGIAEGTETIVVYALLCIWPSATEAIVWVFAAAVGLTAVQRIVLAWRSLTDHGSSFDREGAAGTGPGG